jgi:hypothetical protein
MNFFGYRRGLTSLFRRAFVKFNFLKFSSYFGLKGSRQSGISDSGYHIEGGLVDADKQAFTKILLQFRPLLDVADGIIILRKALQILSVMPHRLRNWVNPYPDYDPVLRSQSTRKPSQQQADIALQKAHHQLSRHAQISGALEAARKGLPLQCHPTDRLSCVVNVQAPGKARGEDRIIASLGCNLVSRSVADPNPKESETFCWIRIRIRKKIRIRIRIQP